MKKSCHSSLLLAVITSLSLMLPAQALDLRKIESEIHRLTNAMRAEKGVAPLMPLTELDDLARRHSQNMVDQQFFSHVDPAGQSPFDRMARFLPGLLSMGSAENIAMRSVSGDNEVSLAYQLMEQWRHSPGHYTNIMSPTSLHLGAGVASNGRDVYATQSFAAGLVLLEQTLPRQVQAGPPVTLRFRYLANFPKEQVSVFLHVPDKAARFPTSDGMFYTGGGPLTPQWKDAQHFELQIPTQYGLGNYSLGIGRKGSYYDTPFQFEAVRQLSQTSEGGSFALGACTGAQVA